MCDEATEMSVYVWRNDGTSPVWFEGTIRNGSTVEVADGGITYAGFRSGRSGMWIFQAPGMPPPEPILDYTGSKLRQ